MNRLLTKMRIENFEISNENDLNTITKQLVDNENHFARLTVSEWKANRQRFVVFCVILIVSQKSIVDVDKTNLKLRRDFILSNIELSRKRLNEFIWFYMRQRQINSKSKLIWFLFLSRFDFYFKTDLISIFISKLIWFLFLSQIWSDFYLYRWSDFYFEIDLIFISILIWLLFQIWFDFYFYRRFDFYLEIDLTFIFILIWFLFQVWFDFYLYRRFDFYLKTDLTSIFISELIWHRSLSLIWLLSRDWFDFYLYSDLTSISKLIWFLFQNWFDFYFKTDLTFISKLIWFLFQDWFDFYFYREAQIFAFDAKNTRRRFVVIILKDFRRTHFQINRFRLTCFISLTMRDKTKQITRSSMNQ